MFSKKVLWIIIISLFLTQPVWAAGEFHVAKIEYRGLQNISQSAINSYFKSPVGKRLSMGTSSAIIQSLYKTGYFSDVEISHRGSTLIIQVVERPTVGTLKITGNDSIESKKLRPVLTKVKLTVGEPYHPAVLKEFVQSLKQQYIVMGHYAVGVRSSVSTLPRNRVAVAVTIKEGPVAKIKTLKIVGAHDFSQRQLLKNFKLTTSGLFSFFSHNDRYSEMRLGQDLQSLQSFYMNHGYLNFKVDSKDVNISPNHKAVDITIHVTEGPVYRVGGFKVDSAVDRDKLASFIFLKKGSVFSRADILAINKNITNYFAKQGYAFPNIQVSTQVNERKHLIYVIFHITEGQRIYVRHVNIIGDLKNNDLFLRSRLRQFEGGLYSLDKVNESLRQLRLLTYIDPHSLAVNPTKVPGKPDQVDLTYKVKEVSAGRARLQAGWSELDGFIYGANVFFPSFIGSGRSLSLGFSRGSFQQNYNVSYFNPMYTVNNIGRGFSISYAKTMSNSASGLDLANYTEGNFSLANYYTFPISDTNSIQLGAKYSLINLSYDHSNPGSISPNIIDLLGKHPTPYNQFSLTAGWSYDSRDRAIFPTNGNMQTLNLNLGIPIKDISSLGYYTVTYNANWFFPLGHGFIFNPHANLGYGDGFGSLDALPFFYNFYGGGIGSLPGYTLYTLGPQFTTKDKYAVQQSLGGNVKLFAGMDFVLPNFISDSVRTAVIVDAGNIYDTHWHNNASQGVSRSDVIKWNTVRIAAGVKVTWNIPMLGPVTVTLAYPLIHHKGDQQQAFGFVFGTSLG